MIVDWTAFHDSKMITKMIPMRTNTNSLRSPLAIAAVTLFLVSISIPTSDAQSQPRAGETIVMVRHGEKPLQGLGQLTCKGLNRALALPNVLIGRYGKPDFIYAPNPSVQVSD